MIRTARLVLREWREDDREPWAAMNADPEVMEYFPSVLDRGESDAVFDRLSAGVSDRGWGLWAVEHEGAFIGFTGLNPVGADLPCAPGIEVGWRLGRSAWGHGFATEAARAALEFAFAQLASAEVVSFTATGNTRSRAVMERIGMSLHLRVRAVCRDWRAVVRSGVALGHDFQRRREHRRRRRPQARP